MTTDLPCAHSDLQWPACLDGLAPPLSIDNARGCCRS